MLLGELRPGGDLLIFKDLDLGLERLGEGPCDLCLDLLVNEALLQAQGSQAPLHRLASDDRHGKAPARLRASDRKRCPEARVASGEEGVRPKGRVWPSVGGPGSFNSDDGNRRI
jgi:hypothetical protein